MEFLKTILILFGEMAPYLLLGFFFAGLLHAFVPQYVFAKYLSKNNFMSVFYAALFGVPLPLCSCGVIPTAMALRKEGASKGSVVSFLIATPQTGVDSIIATYSLLGLPFAIIRPVVAFVTSLFAGTVVNVMTDKNDTDNNTEEIHEVHTDCCCCEDEKKDKPSTFKGKLKESFIYGFGEVLEDIGKWLVVGMIVAGAIAYFVPDNFFSMFSDSKLLSMIIILAFSIPMYICATGSIPIAIALMLKGMSPGTALVLLMAGPATNAAAIMVIGKVLGRKTLILFITTIIIGAVGFGLFIDYFLPAQWFTVAISHHSHEMGSFWIKTVSSVILAILLIKVFIQKNINKNTKGEINMTGVKIGGMSCNKCKATVQKVLSELEGVKSVEVNLEKGEAYIDGVYNEEKVKETLSSVGFDFKGKI